MRLAEESDLLAATTKDMRVAMPISVSNFTDKSQAPSNKPSTFPYVFISSDYFDDTRSETSYVPSWGPYVTPSVVPRTLPSLKPSLVSPLVPSSSLSTDTSNLQYLVEENYENPSLVLSYLPSVMPITLP